MTNEEHEEHEARKQREIEEMRAARSMLRARATESGLEMHELCRLLVLADHWRDFRPGDTHRLGWLFARENWLAELRSRIGEKHAAWSAEDNAAVQRACRAMPSSVRLASDERISKIRCHELRQFAATHNPDSGALIVGPTDAGKTLACVEFVDRVVRKDRADDRTRRVELFEHPSNAADRGISLEPAMKIGAAYEYGAVNESKLEKLTNVRLLIIDDLGWEPPTGIEPLKYVVAERYANGRPTIVTSGWTIQQLRDRYSDAFLRRCREVRGERGPIIDLHPKAAQ